MNELSPYLTEQSNPPIGKERPFIEPSIVEEADARIDLRDFWRLIRKHSWLIGTFFFGAVLTTLFVIFMMTPIYVAETTLLIERQDPQVVDIKQVLSESLGSEEYDYYKTQYQILKSRSLASQVIKEQGLEKTNLFSGEEKKDLVTSLWTEAKVWARGLSASSPKANGVNTFGIQPEVVDTYINDMLEIKPVRSTRLVNIAFSSPDPQLSARLANAHAAAYIRQGPRLRSMASQEAESFLEEKLVELKDRVEKSEAALNRYRRDKGILSLDDKENIVVERLADLNKHLTEAEVERIALEGQVRLIRKRAYDSLPAVINSPLIQTLKQQLARLEAEYAHLSTQFKPGYTQVAQLQAQVQESRTRLLQEIGKVVAGIESAYMAANVKEKELRAKMEEQKAAALHLKDTSVEYAVLAREVDTNHQLYDSVLQRMKEMGVAAELRASNVFLLDEAEPPLRPSKPQKKTSLLLSALVGLIGGLGLAFFFEYLDNTLKTPEEVKRFLRLPALGVVPDFLGSNRRTNSLPRTAHPALERKWLGTKSQSSNPSREVVLSDHPFSLVNEAYRTLRTAILLSQARQPPKSILFTSGTHGEGKTATVVNTAIIFAQMGVKVLVIDGDLRRPSCHKVLGVENRLGLTDLLTGQIELENAIRVTATRNLFLISSGSVPPNPTELVGSKKMHETLTSLQEHYEYILIDSPPTIIVSDAVLLSTMVDGVVLVVSGQETPRDVVKEACSRLRYARAKILGVVLNRMDIRDGDYTIYYNHNIVDPDPTTARGRKHGKRLV
jgi:capsular exopolysaccharide synthesis family protein